MQIYTVCIQLLVLVLGLGTERYGEPGGNLWPEVMNKISAHVNILQTENVTIRANTIISDTCTSNGDKLLDFSNFKLIKSNGSCHKPQHIACLWHSIPACRHPILPSVLLPQLFPLVEGPEPLRSYSLPSQSWWGPSHPHHASETTIRRKKKYNLWILRQITIITSPNHCGLSLNIRKLGIRELPNLFTHFFSKHINNITISSYLDVFQS